MKEGKEVLKITQKKVEGFWIGMKTDNWFVYMVECSDKTIYTGITNNIALRITKHNKGKGAKYTRSRNPVALKAFWSYDLKGEAAKAEYAFKQLTREQKLKLIKTFKKAKIKLILS